jgi:hypothetical protein
VLLRNHLKLLGLFALSLGFFGMEIAINTAVREWMRGRSYYSGAPALSVFGGGRLRIQGLLGFRCPVSKGLEAGSEKRISRPSRRAGLPFDPAQGFQEPQRAQGRTFNHENTKLRKHEKENIATESRVVDLRAKNRYVGEL